jgi:hypothetical protein
MTELLEPVKAVLLGDVDGLVSALGKARGELAATAKSGTESADGMASKFAGAGVAIGAGLAAAGVAAVGFGLKAASAAQDVGMQVGGLERVTGDSAEAMSKLRFAGEQMGISSEDLTKKVGIMSKGIEANKDKFDQYGIATHDVTGHLLGVNDILLNTAEKFKSMPDGIEKNAEAMKLFGKSGLELIPMLDKGKDGLTGLEEEAKKYGLVLSQDQVDAARKSVAAHREMGAAWEGLQVQIGQYVLPVLAAAEKWFAEKIPAAIAVARQWVEDHKEQIRAFGEKVSEVFNTIKTFVVDEVLPKLRAALEQVAKWDAELVGWFEKHKGVAIALGIAIAALAAPFTTLVAALIYAYDHVKWFHSAVDAVIGFIKGYVTAEINAFAAVIGWLSDEWQKITGIFKDKGWLAALETLANDVLAKFQEMTAKVGEWILNTALPWLGEKMLALAETLGGWVQEGIQKLMANLPGWIMAFDAWIGGTAIPWVWNKMLELSESLGAWVGSGIQKLMANLPGWLASLAGWLVGTALPWLISHMVSWSIQMGIWILEAIPRLAMAAGQFITWLIGWVDGTALPWLVDHVRQWAGAFINWIWDAIQNLPGNLENFAGMLLGWIQGLPSRIASMASGMWDGIWQGFKGAINSVIDLWNGLHFSLPKIDWGPIQLGGGDVSVPWIPHLATGGYFSATPGGRMAVVAEAGQDEVVSPVPQLRLIIRDELAAAAAAQPQSQGPQIVQHFSGITDESQLARRAAEESAWQLKTA